MEDTVSTKEAKALDHYSRRGGSAASRKRDAYIGEMDTAILKKFPRLMMMISFLEQNLTQARAAGAFKTRLGDFLNTVTGNRFSSEKI
ncbi:hypothetical protein Plhal304r1_c004g0016361 [Plasmopara halstedii]